MATHPRAWICPHCGNVDDLDPHPKAGESRRCPCPHDEVTTKARARDVEIRHRASVQRVRERARWQQWCRERGLA